MPSSSTTAYVLARARDAPGLIDKSQEFVAGAVRAKLYKGTVMITGRSRPIAVRAGSRACEDDRGDYDQKDAAGFSLNALSPPHPRVASARPKNN